MGGKEGLRAVEAENRLLRRVIETITSNLDLDTLLASLIDLVTEATRGDACFLLLWDPDEEQLVLRAASPEFEGAVGSVRLRLGEGVSGWVAEHREVVAMPEDRWGDRRPARCGRGGSTLWRSSTRRRRSGSSTTRSWTSSCFDRLVLAGLFLAACC